MQNSYLCPYLNYLVSEWSSVVIFASNLDHVEEISIEYYTADINNYELL